ncbi:hypothetical protein LCGC14_1395500 [marine sediment metagenome]|uniref:Uncharacterized protein n=1 Tax=marine sediment metagenome TaxID=412755 RepID=A0A0F9JYQ4_9ZZZZ
MKEDKFFKDELDKTIDFIFDLSEKYPETKEDVSKYLRQASLRALKKVNSKLKEFEKTLEAEK